MRRAGRCRFSREFGGEAVVDVLIDVGGETLACEGEALHGSDVLGAGGGVVIAVTFAVTELDVDRGVVEGEGDDAGFGVPVGLHSELDGATGSRDLR